MGWWPFSRKAKEEPITSAPILEEQQKFFEDLPPKFDDGPVKSNSQVTPPHVESVWSRIQASDFQVEKLTKIPCFREGLLLGFQAMGVLGVTTLFIYKQPAKAANWGVGGFFLGSVFGWEQCRAARRRGFETVEMGKQLRTRKEKMERELEQNK